MNYYENPERKFASLLHGVKTMPNANGAKPLVYFLTKEEKLTKQYEEVLEKATWEQKDTEFIMNLTLGEFTAIGVRLEAAQAYRILPEDVVKQIAENQILEINEEV